MKGMSYRDKMIVLILTIVIILVAGFFALIRPAYNNLVNHTAEYDSTKAEWDAIDEKIQAIHGLESEITDAYNDANKTAQLFVNDSFEKTNKSFQNEEANYSLDQHIQEKLNEYSIKVNSLTLDGVSSETLSCYVYEPNVTTYSLLEAADLNGTYASDINKLYEAGTILGERESVELLTNTITLDTDVTKENLIGFIEAVNGDSKSAARVTDVSIPDYQFQGGLEHFETDVDGVQIRFVDTEGEGTANVTITLKFYNAKEIEKPIFD